MTNKRDLEKRLAELRENDGTGDVEFTVLEEVIKTSWEPADGGETPSAGTSVTRYRRTEAGTWVAEDGGES